MPFCTGYHRCPLCTMEWGCSELLCERPKLTKEIPHKCDKEEVEKLRQAQKTLEKRAEKESPWILIRARLVEFRLPVVECLLLIRETGYSTALDHEMVLQAAQELIDTAEKLKEEVKKREEQRVETEFQEEQAEKSRLVQLAELGEKRKKILARLLKDKERQ